MPTDRAKTKTTTFIRTLFGDTSYINIKFFNDKLSLTFFKEVGKDQNNHRIWDKGIEIRIFHTDAALLSEACKIILEDPKHPKDTECIVTRANPNNDKENNNLILSGKNSPNGYIVSMEIRSSEGTTRFEFRHASIRTSNDNGQMENINIQTDLMTFKAILDSYMSGINSDRHLNKYTDDYAKANDKKSNQDNNQSNNANNYNNNYNRNQNNRWNNNNNWNRNRNQNNNWNQNNRNQYN